MVFVTGWVGIVDAEWLSGASFHDMLSGLEAHEVRSGVLSPMGSGLACRVPTVIKGLYARSVCGLLESRLEAHSALQYGIDRYRIDGTVTLGANLLLSRTTIQSKKVLYLFILSLRSTSAHPSFALFIHAT